MLPYLNFRMIEYYLNASLFWFSRWNIFYSDFQSSYLLKHSTLSSQLHSENLLPGNDKKPFHILIECRYILPRSIQESKGNYVKRRLVRSNSDFGALTSNLLETSNHSRTFLHKFVLSTYDVASSWIRMKASCDLVCANGKSVPMNNFSDNKKRREVFCMKTY